MLLEQELLRDQAADTEDLPGEAFSSAWKLTQALGHAAPVPTMVYMQLIRDLGE